MVNRKNKDRGAYYHELFLRGRPRLCAAIYRSKKRSLLDPNNEPNLYLYPSMNSLHPLHARINHHTMIPNRYASVTNGNRSTVALPRQVKYLVDVAEAKPYPDEIKSKDYNVAEAKSYPDEIKSNC